MQHREHSTALPSARLRDRMRPLGKTLKQRKVNSARTTMSMHAAHDAIHRAHLRQSHASMQASMQSTCQATARKHAKTAVRLQALTRALHKTLEFELQESTNKILPVRRLLLNLGHNTALYCAITCEHQPGIADACAKISRQQTHALPPVSVNEKIARCLQALQG